MCTGRSNPFQLDCGQQKGWDMEPYCLYLIPRVGTCRISPKFNVLADVDFVGRICVILIGMAFSYMVLKST